MALIETDRLALREFNLDDADFILKLVNEPSWIKNIGDKNVHTIADAQNYLLQGPIKSYQDNGFGLYMAELKLKGTPVGMCGLVKRDGLENPDIGFAMMPEFWGMGLASEAARAVLVHAKETQKIERVLGITSLENSSSMRVLEKAGLKFDKMISLPGYSEPSRLFIPN
ncbi:GNAT family N-acetyltransferase [Aliikangiella coralliicola]|uniref:GNAT family N-acetyltransferase n=1 Tax=Aliikangiella coralliicola TaxID=2592383 RepID=A0A545UEL4_9GAMM|nr:GNAT family N-acetyltransferase [Aliikangiella coralliicola]TQV87916.1 GNAT family N-acetyltransferase [Aliikangiella coralliicola]